jgi:FtsP/CotA-like multicopper oxidase with cupredoxin domain
MNYTFHGRLVEEHTDTPVAGLRVEAWDKDPTTDDYLGSAVSGPDGEFTITFDESMFADWGSERYPDVYFKVFRCDDLLLSTENSLIWNVSTPKKNVRIEVPIRPLASGWMERDIYLKIERIEKYSPVRPQEKVVPPVQYGRDCMRNEGHENALIPEAEIQARSLTAVVYREYLDSAYLVPKPDKLIEADINEPVYSRRVPGTVIYARPGQRLRIHVWNCDDEPHSLHVHGLRYGVDSDGSWPFGTEAAHHGGRSDAICPGGKWTYTYEVLENMVGAWPFHDHTHHHHTKIDHGLFGGIVVLPCHERLPRRLSLSKDLIAKLYHGIAQIEGVTPDFEKELKALESPTDTVKLPPALEVHRLKPASRRLLKDNVDFLEEFIMRKLAAPKRRIPTDHVPLFFHLMASKEKKAVFDSGDLEEFIGVFEHDFASLGDYEYFCQHHPVMTGVVRVVAGGPASVSVNMVDGPPMAFSPSDVTVGVGGRVRWENHSMFHHTVTSKQGASMPTHCFNGRGFVGNSPTIVARSGQRIRWFVFNLDTGTVWHNFHPHAMRWKFADEIIDVRSIGPAESFIVETQVPPVILLDEEMAKIQDPGKRPKKAKLYRLKGDFLFHCHVHHHMMNGMVGLIRAKQSLWLTEELAHKISHQIGLALDDGSNACPQVDPHPCVAHGAGRWEEIAGDPEVTFMHSVLLPKTKKVLYWGYTRNDQSRLWDYSTPAGSYSAPANQPATLPGHDMYTSDMWSAEHALLDTPEGHVLIHGGFSPNKSFTFNPDLAALAWSEVQATAEDRFYSTTLVIDDGRALTLFGSASKSIEVYTHGMGWTPPIPMPASMHHHEFYPWTYLLPDGRLFIAGPHVPTQRFNWTALAAIESFPTIGGDRSSVGEKGTSAMLILRPPDYKPIVYIIGGDLPGTPQTAEQIDLSSATPTWTSLPNLNVPRPFQFTATLLPDGRIFIAGGVSGGADGGPCEIFDPRNPGAGWQLGPSMKYIRGYHSSFLLLSDGSILAGGDPQAPAGGPTPHERFFPDYFDKFRPTITNAPAAIHYGGVFQITTPTPSDITEVVLLRPGAVTHGFNMSQRGIELVITGIGAGTIDVAEPPNSNLEPPGWHLLFLLDSNRVPSEGQWIRLTP